MVYCKLTITNNVNDDVTVRWTSFASIDERDVWIKEMREEKNIWNYRTRGAVSFRYYEFENYDAENILNISMSEFSGMSLGNFIDILKALLK